MEYLRKCKKSLRSLPKPPTKYIWSKSRVFSANLDDLPSEILVTIGDFLPLFSAAALTLTTKTVHLKLGSLYFARINKAKKIDCTGRARVATCGLPLQRQTFLRLLDKDSPDLIYCYVCQKLHMTQLSDPTWHLSKGIPIRDLCAEFDPCHMIYGTGWNYARLYMLFKTRRTDRKGHHLKTFRNTTTRHEPECTYQRSVRPTFIGDDLYVQVQHRILFARNSTQDLPLKRLFHGLCAHFPAVRKGNPPERSSALGVVADMVKCTIERFQKGAVHDATCTKCARTLVTCEHCVTQFMVRIGKAGDGQLILTITSWQRMGSAESPFNLMFSPWPVLQRTRKNDCRVRSLFKLHCRDPVWSFKRRSIDELCDPPLSDIGRELSKRRLLNSFQSPDSLTITR